MIKSRRKNFVSKASLVCSFLLLFLLVGCSVQNGNDSPKKSEECDIYQDVPKHQLSIAANFKELSSLPTYSYDEEAFIDFTIQLTDVGKKYVDTELFLEEYLINVTLKDADTEEVYAKLDDLTWNTSEVKKDFHLKLDLSETNQKMIEQKLDSIKNNEYKLSFVIDMSPQKETSVIMSDIGFVNKK